MITILCQNCGGAIEVSPDTSPKKKGECPHCKKLIFKRTGNVVEWSTKEKKLTGKQKLWYTVAACVCFCVIFFGLTGFFDGPRKPQPRKADSGYSSGSSTTKGAAIIKRDCFGATTKDIYDELSSIRVNGSKEAFTRALLARALAGEAKVFHAGERVEVVGSSWIMNKVMGEKDVVGYWVPYEYVMGR